MNGEIKEEHDEGTLRGYYELKGRHHQTVTSRNNQLYQSMARIRDAMPPLLDIIKDTTLRLG